MKESDSYLEKAWHGFKVGLNGLGFLAASVFEPSGAGLIQKAGKLAKVGVTGGKSLAKDVAQTYVKETGVPTSALERLAEDGGKEAIKKASNEVDVDFRSEVAERIRGIQAPKLDDLSKEDKAVFERYQERLGEIMDAKNVKTEAAREAQSAKLLELDQEVRDFMDNIKTNKTGAEASLETEMTTGKQDIGDMAESLKGEKLAAAPTGILGDTPRAAKNQSGDQIQEALSGAEKDISSRYGELKENVFGFGEASGKVIPGKHNPLFRAWSKTMRESIEKYGGRNILDQKQQDAFVRIINSAGPANGPATIGELVNARKHVGRYIWGKTGIEEEDALFRGVDRRVKEDFYKAVNDEIGNELHNFYRSKRIPPEMAEKMVQGWDDFNQQYSGLRSGLEKVENALHYSAQGGKTEKYVQKIFLMGTNDIKKAKTVTLSSPSTAPVWEAIEGAAINDLVNQSIDSKGVFSPKTFQKLWGELSEKQHDKLVALLGEEKVKSVDSFHKGLVKDLDQIESMAQGGVDELVKRLAEKGSALESKSSSAENAVRTYKKVQGQSIRGEFRGRELDASNIAGIQKAHAKDVRNTLTESIAKKRAEVEAIGTVALGATNKGRTSLASALTPNNMTGPRRKAIVAELEKNFGHEEAQKIQDVYFARSLGADKGRIPLITRIPTGRALYLGFISGHPLAVAFATSPQVAAAAMRYGSKPAGALGKAVDRVLESPRLTNLYQVLGGLKKVEARNRVILRIMQEMEREGIELPENEEAPSEDEALLPE